MIQSSPSIELHFSLGVTHNFETLSALLHERNQIAMKLHVEICHVSPILPRSNLLDDRLRNRLIASVSSPMQDRSCFTETPQSLDTKFVPPIQPSFLITLKTFHLVKRFCVKVTGIVRRLGHLRSAKIGESFHLSLRLLSLHFQRLLEHLLLVHQLLTELLELPKHLCHQFSRHTKQSTRLDSQSRVDHKENHSTATRTAAPLQWPVDDGRLRCTYPSLKSLSRSARMHVSGVCQQSFLLSVRPPQHIQEPWVLLQRIGAS